MSDENEDDHDRQLQSLEQAGDVVKHRIERVDPIFGHAINTLWAGNGTASLAVLGAISATAKNGIIDKRTLVPLFLFMSGFDSHVRRLAGHAVPRERSDQSNAGRFEHAGFSRTGCAIAR